MTEKHDQEWVTKGAVRKALLNVYDEKFVDLLWITIGKLPAEPARQALPASGQARPDAEIEKAIKYLEGKTKNSWSAALLRWVLNQKQDTWTDKELLGKEKTDEEISGD